MRTEQTFVIFNFSCEKSQIRREKTPCQSLHLCCMTVTRRRRQKSNKCQMCGNCECVWQFVHIFIDFKCDDEYHNLVGCIGMNEKRMILANFLTFNHHNHFQEFDD